MYILAPIWLLLTILVDLIGTYPSIYGLIFPDPKGNEAEYEIDEDVENEEHRVKTEYKGSTTEVAHYDVESTRQNNDVVTMMSLRKVYRGGKVAVKNLTLGIHEGECLGYLGINGAGKTTTLKMLTGDVFPTSGKGYVKGHSITTAQNSVRQNVGYCSQFSTLLGLLTVREHLELFCKIKNVDDVHDTVTTILARLALKPFEHKLSKSLSGGNKRKLSVGIAMIGSPPVMLLDEPSTGMDVASRRFMWDVIENMSQGRYDGKKTSIILTTHSMEECEALCQRVGIMVGGRLRCLGSVQHLKQRFGSGFTVEIKLELVTGADAEKVVASKKIPDSITLENMLETCKGLGNADLAEILTSKATFSAYSVMNTIEQEGEASAIDFMVWWLQAERRSTIAEFLRTSFANVEVTEEQDTSLRFSIGKSEHTRLGKLFGSIEQNKRELKIAEYAVSQTTLEQIFNGFASQQEEELGRARGVVSK